MTAEQTELLAAAILATLEEHNQRDFSGKFGDLFTAVKRRWIGVYQESDLLNAIDLLSSFEGATRSGRPATSEFVRVNTFMAKAVLGGRVTLREAMPLLYEFSQFGVDWLENVWNEYFPAESPAIRADTKDDGVVVALSRLIPASDRKVRPDHNSAGLAEALERVEEAQQLISQSNQLSEDEKQDSIVHLQAGISVLKGSTQIAIGTVRYLILDRLKAAFEGAIEDAFKLVIIGAFMTLAAFLISLL
jgi:hypothetical protein